MFAIVFGNVINGFTFVGPFTTEANALSWLTHKETRLAIIVKLHYSGDTLDYEP